MLAWRPNIAAVLALAAAGVPLLAAVPAQLPAAAPDAPVAAADEAYSRPLPLGDQAARERFEQGRQLFQQHWVVPPSAFGQWGRGPLSNAASCSDCHAANGRGRPPLLSDEPVRAALVRLSVGPLEAPQPHPAYGDQLQQLGVLGKVPGEGQAYVDWTAHDLTYADGAKVTLRAPRLRFDSLAHGGIEADTLLSLRVAPPLVGLGMLGAVTTEVLEQIAAGQRVLGYSGRISRLGSAVGRFGQKALQPNLRTQIAASLHADLGVTSSVFPKETCTAQERQCLAFPVAAVPEISDGQLQLLEDYLAALAPPAQRDAQAPDIARGEELFRRLQCAVCHVPALQAGDTQIHPYSDLLLHDLGPGLADGRPEGSAGPADWRTAPLWGLGRSQAVNGNAFLLHDGRARSVEEAILWHGGEAQRAQAGFRSLDADARRALIAFIESL
jgi:CxxC motif-containing protein (DUF1111 family)